jgi:hypothetical protein
MNENSEGIGLDALLDSLSNERRRNVILTIASEGMVTKKEMARLIAGEESGDEFDRVRISLHQVHLPKLAERGIVTEIDGGYTFGPNGEEALDALRRLQCEPSNESRLRNLLRPVVG